MTTRSFPGLRALLLPLLALLALPAVAQDAAESEPSFEITPFAAFLFQGNFDDGFEDDDFFDDELQTDESNGFGLIAGFRLARNFDLEISYSQSETTLEFDNGFFSTPDGILDIDVEYLHVGINMHFDSGHIQPFLLASVGATRLGAGNELGEFDDEVRPSAAIGGGIKAFFTDNFGLRIQGRILSTLIDENEEAFCNRYGCVSYDVDTYLYQAEVAAGLILAF
jgi:hypothetical protein